MKKILYRSTIVALAAILAGIMTVSCSDWDSHYNDNDFASGTANLWNNINANENLSDFASLLKKAGYDKVLDNSQVYTVWAPANGSFDYTSLNAMSVDKMAKEFLNNHVAKYSFPASGVIDKNIMMLNSKLNEFVGSGSYTFANINVRTPNLPSINGILNVLDGYAPFHPNIYEYLDNNKYGTTDVANYLHHFDTKKLDIEHSVVGPTVNGQITYLDSVFVVSNVLFQGHGNNTSAWISREDSSYTMIVPTNAAWVKLRNKVSNYFHYSDALSYQDPVTPENFTNVPIDKDYMRDSMINYSMVKDLFFNNKMYDNRKLVNNNYSACDSLVTSLGQNVLYKSDINDLFADASYEKMSNGSVWVTDSVRNKSWNGWCHVIKVEGEDATNFYGSKNTTASTPTSLSTVRVVPEIQNTNIKGSLSDYKYAEFTAKSPNIKPQVFYNLPNPLSSTYNFYVVTVPANISNNNVTKLKPSKFKALLGYNVEDFGGMSKRTMLSEGECAGDKIDTIYVGSFTFPVSYGGLTAKQGGTMRNVGPYLRIEVQNGSNLDNNLRLDCILVVPKELDEYKEANPGYKYYESK